MESLGEALLHSVPEWIELLLLTFSIGTLVCRLWVVEAIDPGSLSTAILPRLWLSFGISIAATAVASGADLLVRTGDMSGLPLRSAISLLPTVIGSTHVGKVWLICEGALLIVLLSLFVGRRYRESPPFSYFLLCLLLAAAMTKSASGHAADAGDLSVPEWGDWLHLVASTFWAGGILVLSTVILPLLQRLPHFRESAATVSQRYSRIAVVAVAGAAMTALYNGISSVGSMEALADSPYGRIVTAKVALFLFAVCLGAANRYLLIPLLERYASESPAGARWSGGRYSLLRGRLHDFHSVQRTFGRLVRLEAFAVVALLGCAAILRHEIPARHHPHQIEGGSGHHRHSQ